MKIHRVVANNRKKAFEVSLSDGRTLDYPYAKLDSSAENASGIEQVHVDPELAEEAFTCRRSSGQEETVHLEQVLEYHRDPEYLRELALYRLTLEAQKRVESSGLSKREIIRRLRTSASQFYRLLDQTNYTKSIGQLLALLEILDCEVEIVVRGKGERPATSAPRG